jgi:HK97 gp10 family phage protein
VPPSPRPVAGAPYIGLRIDQLRVKAILASPEGPVAKAVLRVIAKGERYAKQMAPVDTGRLRSSISHRLDYEGSGIAGDGPGFVGIVGTNVEYAPHVEFGTVRMGPQAFLRPGVEQAVQEGP